MDKDELLNIDCYLLLSNIQFYIVSGGHPKGSWGQPGNMDSTEILKKEGGASWQPAASLPTSRFGLRGVSLPNGHFMVSGEDCLTSSTFYDTSRCINTGGDQETVRYKRKGLKDVLDYDPDADKWTKVGEMADARYLHGMSLVPKETADHCVL